MRLFQRMKIAAVLLCIPAACWASELPSAQPDSHNGASKASSPHPAASNASKPKGKGDASTFQTESTLSGDISGCKLTVCVSTDDKVAGTAIGSTQWWGSTNNSLHFEHTLKPGAKRYYLHVLVEPPSNSRVFLGIFQLSGGAKFSCNGLKTLDSRPDYWKESVTGWGKNYHSPAIANNSGEYLRQCPIIQRLDPYAQALMDPVGREGYTGYVFFSTEIEPSGKKH